MASMVKIFEITVPRKNSLCCAICRIINNENNFLIYSNFCENKFKCRQFLQETPQAMAAPVINRKILETGGSIYIIVTKELFESCTFQDHCDALDVQVMELLDPIPTYIYKACLSHTMEYKLAPRWNKVGLYLVEGQDFLSSTGNVNAITLDIKEIHDNNARLQVEAVNLKIPFVRLNTARPLQHDLQPPVRVLPSMKMANVLRISKTIKEEKPFKDYEHLRTYWKDMHGYILPDYEEGLLFYDIEFFYFKSNIYLYPETCLTSGPLQVLPPPIDPVPVIYKFVGELRARVSKLCGQQLDVCPENTYRAALSTCTPILPRTGRFSAYDTGYGTQSRRVNSTTSSLRVRDTCEIPTKRPRLSLSKINNFFTRETEFDDFDLGISPTCSTSKLQRDKNVDNMAAKLFNVDSIVTSKQIAQKDESKSCYFEEAEKESKSKFSMELADKEEKPRNLNLREKVLRGSDSK